MLKCIFYAEFHTEHGPKVIHEAPLGAVTASTRYGNTPPLFKFSTISDFVIPRREFCGRLFAIVSGGHRIIGFPVCMTDNDKYERNDFIFDFCVVLEEDTPWTAYTSIIRKMARLFANLEEQSSFLSQSSSTPDNEYGLDKGSSVAALCEIMLEDLNNYSECIIPVATKEDYKDIKTRRDKTYADNTNMLNLKLFPSRPQPPDVHAWHVPLSLVRFAAMQTARWDLTIQRILPFIDGTNSISIIATLADTDPDLTRTAVAHLVYYGCVILLDIFSFGAIYAATPEIFDLVSDENMQDECRRYIASPISMFGKDPTAIRALSANLVASTARPRQPPTTEAVQTPSRTHVIDLYISLRQGQPLREWCLTHTADLGNIDIRRFITFGIIKGFLYRIHKYAVAYPAPKGRRKDSMSKYLDGLHCLDEICTDWKVPEKEALQRLKSYGDVVIVNK